MSDICATYRGVDKLTETPNSSSQHPLSNERQGHPPASESLPPLLKGCHKSWTVLICGNVESAVWWCFCLPRWASTCTYFHFAAAVCLSVAYVAMIFQTVVLNNFSLLYQTFLHFSHWLFILCGSLFLPSCCLKKKICFKANTYHLLAFNFMSASCRLCY